MRIARRFREEREAMTLWYSFAAEIYEQVLEWRMYEAASLVGKVGPVMAKLEAGANDREAKWCWWFVRSRTIRIVRGNLIGHPGQKTKKDDGVAFSSVKWLRADIERLLDLPRDKISWL